MCLVLRAVRIVNDRQVVERSCFHGDHVLLQFHLQAVLIHRCLLVARTVSGEKIDPLIIVDENTRIELPDLVRT